MAQLWNKSGRRTDIAFPRATSLTWQKYMDNTNLTKILLHSPAALGENLVPESPNEVEELQGEGGS